MKHPLAAKSGVIALLSLIMLVVIKMVGGIVDERQQRQKDVVAEVAQSYAGAQRTAVPFIVLPYVEEIDEKETSKAGVTKVTNTRSIDHQLLFFPDRTDVVATVSTDFKYRGLFKALVYLWRGHESGSISVPSSPSYSRVDSNSRIVEGTPFLVIGLSDVRGLAGHPQATIDGHPLSFERGGVGANLGNGLYATLSAQLLPRDKTLAFDITLDLRGTESFALVPYGGSTKMTMSSAWPSPSFGGAFLPDPKAQEASRDGFRAVWEVDGLASSAEADMRNCHEGRACAGFQAEQTIDTRFIDPISIYALSNRAIKYAFLFVMLIFAAFFLFELIERLRIHAAQYLLVGFAIALFFLLLISLSEHVQFALAYVIAAAACTLLIASYLSSILGGLARGAAFGTGLAALFAALYVLLQSEDNALLLGSLLLFCILAMTMLVTRKLDWYTLEPKLR